MMSFIEFTALLFIFVKIIGKAPPEHIFQQPEDFQPTEDDVEYANRQNASVEAWYDVHDRRWDIYLGLWLAKFTVDIHTLITDGQLPGTLPGWSAYVVLFYFVAHVLMVAESLWGITCDEFGLYNLPAMWFNL
jgi:hypothetical protein